MHPLQMVISGVTGAPSSASQHRQELIQGTDAANQAMAETAQSAQAPQSLLAQMPQQAAPAAPAAQSPTGSSAAGKQSFLSAAVTAPTQQNTATKTLLGQ